MFFPKTIYVKPERSSDGNWLNTQLSCSELVNVGETVDVGVYELVEVKKLRGEVNEVKKVHRYKTLEKK